MLKRARFGGQHLEARVEDLCRRVQRRRHHPIAALRVGQFDPREVQRAAFPGAGLGCGLAVLVDAAHAHLGAGGREHEFVAGRHRAVEDRAGRDCPAAGHAEDTVHREAESAPFVRSEPELFRRVGEAFTQSFHARAGGGRHREHFDASESRRREEGAHVGSDLGHALFGHPVGLGDHRHAVRD